MRKQRLPRLGASRLRLLRPHRHAAGNFFIACLGVALRAKTDTFYIFHCSFHCRASCAPNCPLTARVNHLFFNVFALGVESFGLTDGGSCGRMATPLGFPGGVAGKPRQDREVATVFRLHLSGATSAAFLYKVQRRRGAEKLACSCVGVVVE